jgi:pre-mRNA-processing factor 39
MHQYARYYEKWRGIRQSASKISDVLDAETLEKYTQEIVEEKGRDIEDIEPLLKEKMDAYTAEVYKNTQEGTNKRWVYEAEIKRSYFHVKPLDRPQLQNWNKYLDFEESLNQPERIRALYERCLVPCVNIERDE